MILVRRQVLRGGKGFGPRKYDAKGNHGWVRKDDSLFPILQADVNDDKYMDFCGMNILQRVDQPLGGLIGPLPN